MFNLINLNIYNISLKYIFIILLSIYVIIAISMNLLNFSIWYDEAIQFWISYGCHPDGLIINKGISEVINLNQSFNHDPGGFSIMLHYWMKISTGLIWIRTLPLILFLSATLLIYFICQSLFRNYFISLLCCFSPFFSDSLIYLSTEIRAYSMECLCCSMAMLMVCKINNYKTTYKILFASLIFCCLMTSRYSAVIVVSVTIVVIVMHWFRDRKIISLVNLLALVIPVISTIILIYYFSLRSQNPSIQTPNYVDSSLNLGFLNVIILIFPFLCAIYFRKKNKNEFFNLSLFVTLLNFAFIFLSLFNIHPADINSKYCISMIFSNLIFATTLVGYALTSIKHENVNIYIVTTMIILILSQHNTITIRHLQNHFKFSNLVNLTKHNIYIDKSIHPCIKYIFSFGKYKNSEFFVKNNITFEKQTSHQLDRNGQFVHKNKMSMNPNNFDIIITTNQFNSDFFNDWEQKSTNIYFNQSIR